MAFFQALPFLRSPWQQLLQPVPADLCSWPFVFPKWKLILDHPLKPSPFPSSLEMPTWLETLMNPKAPQKLLPSKPWPSCRPRLLEKQAKKQNWNSWPSCRPGPQKKKETELDLLAFLAFLQAWPSPEAGEPCTGRVAFLQAAGKATNSWMACLCSPVAPCMHCLLLAGSLLNLLTWLRRHTS